MCPENLIETIRQGIGLPLDNDVLPVLKAGLENGACDCGGPGWRRVAYLNMSDPTQTCPPEFAQYGICSVWHSNSGVTNRPKLGRSCTGYIQ